MIRPRRLSVLAALLGSLAIASGTLAVEPAPVTAPTPTVGPSPSAGPSEPPGETPSAAPDPAPTVEPTPAPADSPTPGASPAPIGSPSPEPADATPSTTPPPTPDAAAGGRYIVVLRPDANLGAATSRARLGGIRVERTFGSAIRGYTARLDAADARRLAADPRVAAVVPDEKITAEEALAAQLIPTGINRVNGRSSASSRIDGIDERVDADVAVYDTGIDPSHPELAVAGGYNCTSSNRADWVDGEGHGTHVAGTVAARDNGSGVVGVAPGARLWAVRILDANGEGYLSWWLCGLDWIAAQKDPSDPSRPLIEVVNMSVTRWGRDDADCGHTNDDLLHQAICRVVAGGTTVVAAAANDSGSAAARVPAAYNEVITVSALADTDGKAGGLGGHLCYSWGTYDVDDTFADFSNYGSDIDLIAPGKCIKSTIKGPTYGYSSGTSMAAPHVTGAAALYKASRPDAPPSEVRWALQALGNRGWRTSTDPDGSPDILLDVAGIAPLRDFSPSAALPAGGLAANESGATWTIPLAAGRQSGFIEPITFSVASVPSPLGASITGPATLWGSAGTATTLSITVPRSTHAGAYQIVVRAAYRTTRIHEIRIPVVVENAAPVASAPVASLISGSRVSASGTTLRLRWAAASDQSPIAGYELGELTSVGTASVARTGGGTRTANRLIPFSSSRTYAVRATDAPGNIGTWAAAPSVRVTTIQESSRAVSRSSGWSTYAYSRALGGRAVVAMRAGSRLRLTFTGSAIALVGPKGPTRGSAQIRLDGVLVRTVSAYSSSAGSGWLLDARSVDPSRSHTLEVRLLGTSGHPRFDVDAFLVLR